MDDSASYRQRDVEQGLLVDHRPTWDIMDEYVESNSISMCAVCRQMETMELSFGGNSLTQYACTYCGAILSHSGDNE